MRWAKLWGVAVVVLRWMFFRADRKRPHVTRVWVRGVRLDIKKTQYKGYVLVTFAIRRKGVPVGQELPEEVSVVPKKPEFAEPVPGVVRKALAVPRMFAKTPALASHLVDLDYEDGQGSRKLSYLNITPSVVGWSVTLKDPSTAKAVRLTVADLDTAWAALEALLTSGTCPWEPDHFLEEKLPKKKGKK